MWEDQKITGLYRGSVHNGLFILFLFFTVRQLDPNVLIVKLVTSVDRALYRGSVHNDYLYLFFYITVTQLTQLCLLLVSDFFDPEGNPHKIGPFPRCL